ncbi:tetratricopeptide repeat protein [Thermithiobacillus plumbiphilus]|uniref:Tetratricopeptide repeat protein n=1 Tax=Thermithiobacillus plumbiphilus TaxID=1729899 RepID=A0ABU9D934_9PROT
MSPALLATALLVLGPGTAQAQDPTRQCLAALEKEQFSRALTLGKKAVKNSQGGPAAYLCLGQAAYQAGDLKTALIAFQGANRHARTLDERRISYNWLGKTHLQMSNLKLARLFHEKELRAARQQKKRSAEAIALNNLAVVLQESGDLDKAIALYQSALALQRNPTEIASAYNNIASIYAMQQNYFKAISFLRQALDIFEKQDDRNKWAMVATNLGDTYRKAQQYDEAETILKQGLAASQATGNRYWEASAQQYLGLLYRDQGKPDLAKRYFVESAAIFKEIDAKGDFDEVMTAIAALGSQPPDDTEQVSAVK